MSQNMEWPPIIELGKTLAFYSSVIKSGESWSPECAAAYDRANKAMQELYATLSATRPDTGELVSRERVENRVQSLLDMEQVFTPDQRRAAALLLTELYAHLANISRLSTAPAGDVVSVPRELDRKKLEALAALWGYTIEETAGSYAVLIDLLVPTPSPQTSPATEGEVKEAIEDYQFLARMQVGIRDCIGLDRDKLTIAKRLRAKGFVTIADSANGPMIELTEEGAIKALERFAAPSPAKAGEAKTYEDGLRDAAAAVANVTFTQEHGSYETQRSYLLGLNDAVRAIRAISRTP